MDTSETQDYETPESKELEWFSKPLDSYVSCLEGIDTADNDVALDREVARSPKRKRCANCMTILSGDRVLPATGIAPRDFLVCATCTHVNRSVEPTPGDLRRIYGSDADQGLFDRSFYASGNYERYQQLQESVYRPKAQFLRTVLAAVGHSPEQHLVLDVGAGSGSFLAALRELGFSTVGLEPNGRSVADCTELLNLDVKQGFIEAMPELDCLQDVTIVSALCVLPHLRTVSEFFGSVRSAPNLQFIYALVPLFSLTAVIDQMGVAPYRMLGGAHLHMHTSRSLRMMESDQSLDRIGAWWFGTDAVSLDKALPIGFADLMESKTDEEAYRDNENRYSSLLNDLQAVLDKYRMSDQVHIVWKLRK